MNTLGLKKEVEPFGPKPILLTLKEVPRNCDMTTVIEPIGKNRNVKIVSRKVIKINSKDVNDTFVKQLHNFDTFGTGDQFLPKITQITATKRRILPNPKQCTILNNAVVVKSEYYQKFNKILRERQKTANSNNTVLLKRDSGHLESKDLTSTSNKHDRFVPNILRSTKMAENTLNNNILIGFHPIYIVSSHGIEKNCEDRKNLKPKRKQLLSTPDMKCDWTHRAQISHKRNELNRSLLRIRNHNAVEKSGIKTLESTATNSVQKNINIKDSKCFEMKPESTATAADPAIDISDPKDSYTANLNIPDETHNLSEPKEADINCIADKSIQEIFAEFEVADYQNYIESEDLNFDIIEMDKLLNSDIDGSLTNSSIFDHGTKIVEYDVNGNDIDNLGNALKKSTDNNKRYPSDIQCKIEACCNDGAESQSNTSKRLKRDINLDGICSGASDPSRSNKTSGNYSWLTKFENYYSSDDFLDLQFSFGKESSSTDTASESEMYRPNPIQSLSLVSPKNENFRCSKALLGITDVVPDEIFNYDHSEIRSDGLDSDDDTGKRLLDSSSISLQNHLNSNDSNGNDYCTSLSGKPLERFTNDLKLFDELDSIFELFEDGNFLADDMLSNNFAVSREDETCESILANGNVKFDIMHSDTLFQSDIPNVCDNELSVGMTEQLDGNNILHSDISDLDIKNTDNIAISKLLRLNNAYDRPPFSDMLLQSDIPNVCDNELSVGMTEQLEENNILHSDISDLDIKNADDIGISKLLELSNAYERPPFSDTLLQSDIPNVCDNELSVGMTRQLDENNILHNDISDLDIENADNIEISKLLRLGNAYDCPPFSDTLLQSDIPNVCDNELSVGMTEQLDENNILHSDISDLDIKKADNIGISKLLSLDDAYNHPSVSDTSRQSYISNVCDNELSVDMTEQLNENNIFNPNHNNSQSLTTEFEYPIKAQAENILNKATYANPEEEFSFENEVETGVQGRYTGDADLESFNSSSVDIPSINDELLLARNAEVENINSTKSSSPCSTPLLIEKRNTNKLKSSKLESLPTPTLTCMDYPSGYCPSAISHNSITDPKIADIEHCAPCSEVDSFDSIMLSYERSCSQVTGYQNIDDTVYSYAGQENNLTRQRTMINLHDDYRPAERRNHRILELDSLPNQDSHSRQLIPSSVSMEKPSSSGKLPINSRKPIEHLWRDLAKRRKSPRQNNSDIPCQFCDKRYRSEAALTEQIAITHQFKPSRYRYKDKKYICSKCSKAYCLAGAIERHFKLHENYILTCRICKKHFSETIFLRHHMNDYHLPWKVQCKHCDRKFPRKNMLTQHLKNCHGSQGFWSESAV